MASASCAGDGRPFRAPPPTPIATGKGSRSAAVDDRVLTEYLERSLRVPELSFPEPCPLSSALRRRRIPAEIDLGALLAGDAVSAERLLASAAVVGAFRIDGHGVSEGNVRAAMEVAAAVFGIPGERRGELGRYLRRRGGAREEFRWLRPAGAEDQAVLRGVWPDSYSAFREKLESMCTKLEGIAEAIGEFLSPNMGTPHSEAAAEDEKASPPAVLCLRKYSFDLFGNPSSSGDVAQEASGASPPYALSLHLLGCNREFVIQSEVEGSLPFPVPTGSIVVTLSKRFQELCNREFKGVDGEPIYELSSDLGPSFSLEYMCTPKSLSRSHHRTKHTARALSLKDQLLIALAMILLYRFWVWISGS